MSLYRKFVLESSGKESIVSMAYRVWENIGDQEIRLSGNMVGVDEIRKVNQLRIRCLQIHFDHSPSCIAR